MDYSDGLKLLKTGLVYNMTQNELVIGDVHGHYDELIEMISMVPEGTRIIITGDLIDRGPKIKEVLDYCISNKIEVCLGNHELMAIEAEDDHMISEDKKYDLYGSDWFVNGGDNFIKTTPKVELLKYIEYFKTLPLYIGLNNTYNGREVIASHSYILEMLPEGTEDRFQEDFSRYKIFSMVWNRRKPNPKLEKREKRFNIHGHTPTDWYAGLVHEPYISETSMNIDTGVCYGTINKGYLTGILLPENKILQVKRKYKEQ